MHTQGGDWTSQQLFIRGGVFVDAAVEVGARRARGAARTREGRPGAHARSKLAD